ncbi:Farnesyl diphosphate synthase [Candidatus Filomicrobium marinum]|uniref:Probable farnesyl diphosphate synthase n=1 Tax=Candidatus Filomicrobium marinum TaxID=1608628 RepID=A0A0D6JDN8_9HYPH|nr:MULTISPECIES: farnesyl diphosphate synthase [Filomicrobium]MCV0368026.1 polyprenyl synthetase family protein [Filomicrobium sp.]CFX15992.1 Farnesyl diphosphate synthase [Candidatus Filomicrobium marinum]CPR18040.1 Farnesyl diphosphate synthase [Candidatus Filomicrobium marinum]
MNFAEKLRHNGQLVESKLEELLNDVNRTGAPERLVAAMRHGMLGGGKRLRPFLVIESAALFDVPSERTLACAVAVELVHGYSLIHDDLPAMDDDQLRRGKPTVWAAFDEWTAILAGDALQALAFQVLADTAISGNCDGLSAITLTRELAAASGAAGMVGGQAIDLESEKLSIPATPNVDHVTNLQAMKTGRLIRFSCEAGAVLAGHTGPERAALRQFGEHLGVAFQIADDLLDAEGDAERVGKAVAKDTEAGKATLVSLMGIDAAREALTRALNQAKAELKMFGKRAETLIAAAEFVASRDH